ncbi:MAG TPA: phosphotransferase [Bacteroidales bacterium]|nr:phosphotransferase [Bacteroidales bacterium]
MEKEKIDIIAQLFQKWCNRLPQKIEFLPPSGSYRSYCRMQAEDFTALGAWNADAKENEAFLSFSRSFSSDGLPVPAIYGVEESQGVYLLEDLGTDTLFDCVKDRAFNESLKTLYQRSLKGLVSLQLKGKVSIDYSKCYPRAAFDRDSMMWDLNYFKYYFLKLVRIPFDEQALEDDFRNFTDYLLQERSDFFLFRDFQSANIMIKNGEPYFIDYQGGRRGALQYDPASLLFDAKARIPKAERQELISYYVDELEKQLPVDRTQFMGYYQGYVLIRLMQAMGAFGFRGVVEKKPGFMESIPPALDMFKDLLEDWNLPIEIPELKACFKRMIDSAYLNHLLETHL